MLSTSMIKRISRKALSILLILAVILSLTVSVGISASAEEVVAENSEIYAILYYIDPSLRSSDNNTINNNKNIELVFQKGNTLDSMKTVVTDKNGNTAIFSIANDPTNYTGTSSNVPATPWFSFNSTSSNQNITRVDFKDRVKPLNIDGWFRNCKNLEYDNILHKENLDTSLCASMTYTFSQCNKFTTFDFSDWTNLDFSSVTKMFQMFSSCTSLYTMDLTGVDPVNCSDCTSMFTACTSLKSFKFGSFKAGNNVRKSSGADVDGVTLSNFLSGCTKLESVDMSEIDLNFPRSTQSMFENCKALTVIDVSRMYGNTPLEGYSSYFKNMFKNCTSLESVNFNLFPHTFGYNDISGIFTGCVSLREFYLEDAKKTNNKYNTNIFADTDNISYVAITPNWVANYDWVPSKTTWKKVKMAKVAQSGEVAVGTELSNTALFKNFQKKYAGTWAAVADFAFNANGGKAAVSGEEVEVQFVSGTKGTALNYDSSIVTPTREGYSFNGWHTDRTENSPFASGGTAEQWTYYAHWTDHTYKLILNANGGYIDGTSNTRIEYNNLKYSELKKLDKDAFVNDGGKILVGWNTRADGSGQSYAPDDSVNMLTAVDGGEVTLYAIWHAPQAIVSFDAQGGSAVEDKHFDNLPESFGILSDSQRAGYTFLGWFTEDEGGTQVFDDTPVTGSCTLYAHWERNPVVVFDAGDGYFDGDSTKKTVNKVYKYNSHIGVTPTPENGSASFLGWYAAGSSDPVSSEYEVNGDVTLTARWGYVPVFDSDGGVLGDLPSYAPQTSPLYTIKQLPSINKENFTFLGWKHGDDWVLQAGQTLPSGGVEVNLAGDNVIKAIWEQKPYVTVTLDTNGGSFSAGTINPIKVYKNTPIAALPAPTRDGYDFEGWYLGSAKQTVNSTFSEDTTLTAHWAQRNRTVTFNAGDGVMDESTKSNVVKTKTVKVASGKTIANIPGANYLDEKGGILKSFAGWYTQQNGQGTRLESDTVINANTTYYAYWVDNKEQDETYKYTYYAQWNMSSDSRVTDTGDRLVFHPLNGAELSADLKVFFQTEGTGTPVPVGGLKIKVPKYIFKNWSNQPITSTNAEAGVSNNITLDSTSDPDYYIYTNIAALSGSDTVFTLNYTFSPLNVNGGYVDENGYYHDGYVNDDIHVMIQVDMDNDGNLETSYTKNLSAEVHTKVDTTVSKFRSDVSLTWKPEWGDAPADAEDYFYVIWSLNSTHAYANYSQRFYLKWDENTVRENGTVVYASQYVAHGDTAGKYTGLQNNGTKTYTVVTKHRRDLARPTGGDQWATVSNEAILNVKWQSGYIEQFRTSASTTAYIPTSGGNGFSFHKAVPDKDNNESHFKHGGQELLTNREAENMPKLPYEINYVENKNDDNPSWNGHTGKYTAPKRTLTLTDGVSSDVVISSCSDNYSTDSWANSTALGDGDYYFDSLKITVKEYDASKMGGEWSNPYEHTILSDYGETQIWIRKMNSDTFTLLRESVITSTETTVSLPADTVGYKIVHESEFFSTSILVRTNLCLKPTAKLAALANRDILNGDKTLIKNRAALSAVCGNSTRNYSSDSSTWPCTYVLDLSSTQLFMRKSCASQSKITTDPRTMSELSPAVISGWCYNNSGNKKRFTDGEFYDLLPKDVSVDKNSIFVKPILENWSEKDYENKKISADNYDADTASGTLSKGSYSVSFDNDWEGSGRTLMTVSVSVPDSVLATGVHVYYKMRTQYSSIYINSTTQNNMAAFKDNTDSILPPENRVSTLDDNAIDPNYKYCFTGFDSDRTAYASDSTDFMLPPIHESGIDSTVRAEMTSSKHQTVGLNTDYTYYISYGSGVGAVTEDLVFYNVLEHRLDGLESDWQGEFKGVDVSALRSVENMIDPEATCAPVVYYAVKTGANAKPKDSFVFDSETEDDDFNLDRTFWTTELPENLDDVTAIAVDCRTDSKGNPFQLAPESTISFNINMHSSKDPTLNNIFTYNETILRFTMADTSTRVNQHTQTDVLLHYQTPSFEKIAFPASGSDENHPAEVVKNSVLEYTLKITNPDTEVPMNNIVLTDTLNAALVKVNTGDLRVRFGDGEETEIGRSVHLSSWSLETVGGMYQFEAVVKALDPGDSISVIIPVTVTGNQNEKIDNTAKITSFNGTELNLESNTNYHVVDNPKVKILKINCKGEPLQGATLTIYNDDAQHTQADYTDAQGNPVTNFVTTSDVMSFSITPGKYILHEVSTPDNTVYKLADDIEFRIDSDGFAYVDGTKTDIIKMEDSPKYKVVFHENQPDHDDKVFRIYEPLDLNQDKKIPHFYDIPEWAGDEYVFAGWYHNSSWTQTDDPDTGASTASSFENDSYPNRGDDADYHLYAKWIRVGEVGKDASDVNVINGNYRGFGLAGVQIRAPQMFDSNYNEDEEDENDRTPGGLRFVTSLSESLLSDIDALSAQTISTDEGTVNVEYGYAVGTEDNIRAFLSHYNVSDESKYKLQYKGANVNGVNTNPAKGEGTADTDFRYITNVNCTRGTTNSMGSIKDDHRNFTNYRLYTLVVTYEGEAANKSKKIDARAYIRYYDANGKLRVFYNDYKKNMYYGGCLCSFNQVSAMALPQSGTE